MLIENSFLAKNPTLRIASRALASALRFGFTAAWLISAGASAQGSESSSEHEGSPFSISGFGTAGLARSTNSRSELLRSIAPPKGISDQWSARNDSALGMQLSYRFNEQFDAAVQAVSHYRDDGSFRPNMTWAFLKYDISPRLSLRLGRIGTEFLMQADSRLVGYSYLPVRPAIEFYGIIPINFGDGIDARIRWPLGDGILRLEAFGGIAEEDLSRYKFKGTRILKGSLGYDIGSWQFRYINTQTILANNIEALAPLSGTLTLFGASDAARRMEFKGTVSTYQSLAVAYDDGEWQLQGGVNSVRHEATLLQNSRASYLLAGRRLGSVTPYVSYSQAKSSAKSLDAGLPNMFFAEINNGVAEALKMSQVDSRTASLGVRWDLRRNMDLKAQVDFVRAGKASNLLFTNADPDSNTKATVFSLSLDFIF